MNEHDRSRFGNAFFQNLSVFRFFVIEQRVHIDRLIELADTGINSHLAEQRFHTEGASFVRNDGNDEFADFRIAQQFRQQPHEDHGGRNFAAFGAFVEFFEVRFGNRLDGLGTHFALRHIAAELLAPFLHILDFRAVVRRAIERRVMQFFVGNWNAKARAEHPQLVVVELLLLVSDVLAFASFAQSVTFNCLGQNDGRRALVLDCRT